MSKLKNPCINCSNAGTCDVCIEARQWLQNMVTELNDMLPALKKKARPWTGEYAGGKIDLINEILGLPKYDWGDGVE